jgi:DNA invertase Pin-like site-specific DNA recombinase
MASNGGRLVGYYRVSTDKQGKSGLGLEAQRAAVHDFAKRTGGTIAREYTEVESGRKSNRPELAKALAHARRAQGLLCVAKLDRLARNVAFLSALMESGVDFVACDNPHANKLTIHILAAVAEDEAERISQRTKVALAALIERGGKLGNPQNLSPEAAAKGRKVAAQARTRKADEAYADLYPLLAEKRAAGLSLQQIADFLNAEGYRTRRNREWNKVQVKHVLERGAHLWGA